jgi:L-ribulose-5-phosphate 3-epimerase
VNRLYQALAVTVPDLSWLDGAVRRVAAGPATIGELFPAAARCCGRDTPLPVEGYTAGEAARVVLLAALPLEGDDLVDEIVALYRHGDAAEKRAVLKALPVLPVAGKAVGLLEDALRTNDTRLVAAAMGPYAAYLDDAAWRQGVLKCVFMGVPLSAVHGLADRADAELGAMLAGLAAERRAAGRDLPADANALLARWEA